MLSQQRYQWHGFFRVQLESHDYGHITKRPIRKVENHVAIATL